MIVIKLAIKPPQKNARIIASARIVLLAADCNGNRDPSLVHYSTLNLLNSAKDKQNFFYKNLINVQT